MRAFVGIDITDARTASALESVRTELGAPRGPRQDHVTLAFLGEIDAQAAAAAADALAGVRFGAFDAQVAGLGAFPSPRRARVVWAGIRGGAGEAAGLARLVAAALGLEAPARLVPHVTVSRVKSGQAPPLGVIRAHRDTEFGVQRVTSFSLKRSDPDGARHVHTALRTVEAST
ncbi:MAG: RNA 2',3'-cyclic phosphodiesterase [Thaumarchaeota archaeon]|nr:RNA 2',3'-cyclic phosphodiesterase [Nitrososphaerota archaeon]